MPQSFRDKNIPFPSIADTVTPAAFGQPLSADGFLDRRASWVLMEKQSFDLPFTKAVSPLPPFSPPAANPSPVETLRLSRLYPSWRHAAH